MVLAEIIQPSFLVQPNMKVYINGIGSVNAQQAGYTDNFLAEIQQTEQHSIRSIEPDYKAFINPTLIRRMGRIIKMGVASAKMCLNDAGVEQPDAILTGTGLGCIEDTEKFLGAIIQNNEQFLTPTSFIQSTHNTVGGQIALMLGCNNYNFTYVHRAFSFESCVQDAMMLLAEKAEQNVLLGGVDELTVNSLKLIERLGQLKNHPITSLNLLNYKTRGSIAGEGANFFVFSAKLSESSYAQLLGCKMLYKPENTQEITESLQQFLQQNKVQASDIDLVLYGYNGDVKYDRVYNEVKDKLLSKSSVAYFKHLCGEYHTSNSFAYLLAAHILKTKSVSPSILLDDKKRLVKTILIYNHYRGINHTFSLLKAC